jgi:L-fuculose-phosphate aldolase
MTHAALRRELADMARAMSRRGLSQGTSGNLSVRVAEGLLITPSAVPYAAMGPESMVLVDPQGQVIDPGEQVLAPADEVLDSAERAPAPAGHRPSTEWRLHSAILAARPEVSAVVHTHSMFCTTLACLRMEIPAFHYMVAVAGGDSIRCAPYATFGTAALADQALAALEGRRACLLANHGMVALGPTPGEALALAVEVETLAEQYWRVLQAGQPALLSAEAMADALAAFSDYRG